MQYIIAVGRNIKVENAMEFSPNKILYLDV